MYMYMQIQLSDHGDLCSHMFSKIQFQLGANRADPATQVSQLSGAGVFEFERLN